MGAREKARRKRVERMGRTSLAGAVSVSKRQKKQMGSPSKAVSSAELPMQEEEEEEEVVPEQSALQKRVRRAYKRNSVLNLMSTAASMSLMEKHKEATSASERTGEDHAAAMPAESRTEGLSLPSQEPVQSTVGEFDKAFCSTPRDANTQPNIISHAPEVITHASVDGEEISPRPPPRPSCGINVINNEEEEFMPCQFRNGSILVDPQSGTCKMRPPALRDPTAYVMYSTLKHAPRKSVPSVPSRKYSTSEEDQQCNAMSENIETDSIRTASRVQHTPRDVIEARSGHASVPVIESYERQNLQLGIERRNEIEVELGVRLLDDEPGTPEEKSLDVQPSDDVATKAWGNGAVRKSIAAGIQRNVSRIFNVMGNMNTRMANKSRKKKKACSAHILFGSMHINVHRLQLCVPLDYLAEQAHLELMDDDRRKRREDASAQARPGVTTGMCAAGDKLLKQVANDGGKQTKESPRSSQAVTESVDTTLLATPECGAGGEEVGTPEADQMGDRRQPMQGKLQKSKSLAQSFTRTITRTFDAVPSYHDVARKLKDAEHAKKEQSHALWNKLRMRNMELPVERMLGTALVQAFLGIKAIISKADLAEQARIAGMAPWQMPNNRPFTWCLPDLFLHP
eukprot:gene3889-4850_t